MAVYTTQIRSIVEQANADHNFVPDSTDPIIAIEQRIENARQYIFSFNYPILQVDKERFEKNFLRHFYTREIGLETYTLWRLKLSAKLNLLIPKYNKYFEEATKYVDNDLLNNSDYRIVRNYEGTRTDNLSERMSGSDTDTSSRDYVRAYSDTPQGNMQNLLDEKYLTNLTHEYDNNSQIVRTKGTTRANTGTQDNEGNEVITRVGKDGGMTYAEALLKARETYLNIDLMLCDELDDLFMQIW